MSDLGDGCPVAASPALTTLTTEQPSKSCALSWAFQVTTALPERYKMQESWCYLRTSWAACEARTGAQLGLTVSVFALFLFIIQSLWRKALPRGKERSELCPWEVRNVCLNPWVQVCAASEDTVWSE